MSRLFIFYLQETAFARGDSQNRFGCASLESLEIKYSLRQELRK